MKTKEAIEALKRINLTRIHPFFSWEEMLEVRDMAIEALEKQIPMKPIYSDYDDNGFDEIIPNEARCPICEHEFEFGTWNEWDTPYCVCGQKMDWSE